MESYVDLAVFLIAGASFPALVIIGGALLRPHFPDPAKLTTYESGEIPFGDARVKYHAHYYIFVPGIRRGDRLSLSVGRGV